MADPKFEDTIDIPGSAVPVTVPKSNLTPAATPKFEDTVDASGPQNRQQAEGQLNQAITSFNPQAAQPVEAFKHGFSTTLRAIDRISNRFIPEGAPAPAPIEQMPIVKNLVPQAGYEPKGVVEHVFSLAGNLVDPFQYLVGKAGSIAGEKAASGEALAAAEQAFAGREAADTAKELLKQRLIAAAKKGAVEGGIQGSYIGGATSIADGEKDPSKILKRSIEGGVGGALAGTVLSTASTALLKRPKFTEIEKFTVPETPTTQALQGNMDRLLSKQAQLAEDMRLLQGPQSGNEKLLQKAEQVRFKDAELVDQSSQKAAQAEFEGQQLKAVNPSNEQSVAVDNVTKDRLSSTSDELDSRLKQLDSKRQQLLGLAQQGESMSQAKADEVAAKLQSNLNEQQSLKDHMESLGFEANRAKKNIPEMLDIAHAQVKKVEDSLNKGFLTPDQAQVLKQSEFDNALRLQGYNPSNNKVNPLGAILNRTEQMNQIDRVHGTRAGEVIIQADIAHNNIANYVADNVKAPLEASKRLVASGIPENDVPRLLQYIESDSNGNVLFNPSGVKSPSLTRPEYYGPGVTPEQMQDLVALRQWFDQTRTFSGADKARGYVPLMSVEQGLGKASAKGIVEPSHLQERTAGELIPGQHETNIFKMIPRYARQVARANFLAEPLDQGIAELNKLRLLGKVDAANKVDGALKQALGLKDTKEMSELMAGQVVNYNRDILNSVAKQMPDPEGFIQQVAKESNRMMYLSLVPTKFVTFLKQAIQPELMGTAEIGVKNMAKGRTGMLQTAYREVADRLVGQTKTRELPELAEVAQEATSKIAKGLRLVSNTLKPFERAYDAVEVLNRKTSIVGALRQAEEAMQVEGASGLRKISDNMLTSEKNLVERTLQTQGEQAARELYAVLRARRINFSYGLADKPEMLNNMLGKQVPFTGFARGVMNRIVGDITEGNPATLAKRIVQPMVGLYLFEKMTGYSVPGAQPAGNALDFARMSIAPQYTEPLKTLSQSGSLPKAAEKVLDFTPVGAYKRLEKQIKEGGSDPVRQLGLKPANQSNNWLRKLEKY